MSEVCIALDAMGGDNGPTVVVPAALKALSLYPQLNLILVGKSNLLETHLRNHGGHNHPRISLYEAGEIVEMDEPPASALRTKRDSSMRLAIELVRDGKAKAAVSAGNTGALMAIARFVLKTLPGIDRPAIVNALPSMTGHTYMLDLGANVDCAAEHLFQFAVMGSVLATAVDNNPRPRVGLLNIGSEPIKGSEQVKRAAELCDSLNNHGMNYIGFVEGDDIYKGTVDVVVCDGFVGNIALKASEGLAKMLLTSFKQEFTRNLFRRMAALFAWPVLIAMKRRFDPSRHNGASLLGLNGIVIKSHGKADIEAFTTAIRVAMLEAEKNVPEMIKTEVAAFLGKHESVIV